MTSKFTVNDIEFGRDKRRDRYAVIGSEGLVLRARMLQHQLP
ncbi:hypothetical protein [Streptomyces sp. NPDC020489]